MNGSIPPKAWRFLLWGLAAIPAVVAVVQLGRIHPDELYQTLEPAYFRAHGYGVLAWEWHQGIRNWAIPILFAWLLKLCDAIGIRHPVAYRAVLEIPQYLLHAWMLGAVLRYAQRRIGERRALLAMAAVGLYGPVIVFAGRTMGESFSAAFVVIALEYLDRPENRGLDALAAGALIGAAIIARYGSVVFTAAVLIWLMAARRFKSAALAAGGLAAAMAALGALDWMTWGRPFHSLLGYFQFNVLSGQSAQRFGAAPPAFYLPVIATALPLWTWVALPIAMRQQRRRFAPALFVAACYLAAISITAHKEERFVYPALVLIVFAAAPGIIAALARVPRPDLRGALASLVLFLSFAPILYSGGFSAERGDQFRAIVLATRPSEVTGLLIVNEGLWGSGGYFYIGKNIAWVNADWPQDYAFRLAMADRRFNRVVTYDDRALPELQSAGFRVVERIGRATVLVRPSS